MMTQRFVWLCALAMIAACGRDRGIPSQGGALASSPPTPELGGLAWPERIELEQTVAMSDARFAPTMDEGGPVLASPGSLSATLTPRGAHLFFGSTGSTGSRELELVVAEVGRAGSVSRVDRTAQPFISGAQVRTDRGAGVVEWWRSLPSGLEHGVTLERRPEGEGELSITIEVGGDLSPRLRSSDAVELRAASGEHVATYAHLVVLDAAGARVPARMGVEGGRIVLAVDDAVARYPLVVDPLVSTEDTTLRAFDGAVNDQLGNAISVSSDGTRALVGAFWDDTVRGINAGSARVFLRTGAAWVEEATLLAADGARNDELGWSVALSADGTRAILGARFDTTPRGTNAGTARVFVRSGTSWVEEATLLAADGEAGDGLGWSVAISSDGSRALVGVHADNTPGVARSGSARVFLRTGTTWVQEATLLAPDRAMEDGFGESVALSSDGSRALIGVPGDDSALGELGFGSARVFLRTGTTWVQEATLLAPDGSAFDQLGFSVALTGDGTRALVGAYRDDTGNPDAGSAQVFVRAGTAWTHEAALIAPDGAAGDQLATAVALSSDGSRALLGAPRDDTAGGVDAGSARVFVRVGSAWAMEATLRAPDGAADDQLATSVALFSDGSSALVGVPSDDETIGINVGSARVFSVLSTIGSPCTIDATCGSGFCTDGVCCQARCGGGPSDCQACSAVLTDAADGTCAPLGSSVAPDVICRAGAGCDAAEHCTSTSTACPEDVLSDATTECRPASGACDAAETCTGSSPDCPADGFAVAGTLCRALVGACDVPETCSGTSAACPADAVVATGTICRAAAPGGCDLAEVCDGVASGCPGDAFTSAGTVCRSQSGLCDLEERCPGGSALCPPDAVAAAGLVCRPERAGGCDRAEVCTGLDRACPENLFAPVTTPCGAAPSDVCDAPDHCSGTSADCEQVYLPGVECRASTGGCDPAEVCSGSEAGCPPDQFSPGGTVCRASTEASCDPLESCDGVASSCPADVTRCGPMPDAGPIDVGADAAGPPPATSGCACRVSPAAPFPAPLALGVALALALGATRRRR